MFNKLTVEVLKVFKCFLGIKFLALTCLKIEYLRLDLLIFIRQRIL